MKDTRNIFAFFIALGLISPLPLFAVAEGVERQEELPPQSQPPAPRNAPEAFMPPSESELPDNEFGRMVLRGKQIFTNTGDAAEEFVGNGLTCSNCHLDSGRLANSAPLWGAWPMYPAFRAKNNRVNTMTDRIQGCFVYSMNGTPPPADSETMVALLSYHSWLAQGAPTGVDLPGRGYPKVPDPEQEPNPVRGKVVYEENCAICHGEEGQGKRVDGSYVFPPLWGLDSYNWGAGMHRINTAASFIKYNMPLGLGGELLSDQAAWDVAAYVNAHPRPQDPRFEGKLERTDETFHDHMCLYGDNVDGVLLGGKKR